MGISFDGDTGIFHLFTKKTSYIIKLTDERDLLHLYWGKKISNGNLSYLYRPFLKAFSPNTHSDNLDISYDTLPVEYSFYGTGDFRSPAIVLKQVDGSSSTELKYVKHVIENGKPQLEGLPATYVESQEEVRSLRVFLEDGVTGVVIELLYSVFDDYDVITRSAKIINGGLSPCILERALSCTVHFRHSEFEMIQLSGSWARERHIVQRKLAPGTQSVESRRGSSSHMQNPFLGLKSPHATEDSGEVYGFSLVYSGNFLAEVEVDQFFTTRVNVGINPFGFTWNLAPGASFQTPETVLVYSEEGMNGLSQRIHKLFRERLCRGEYRDRPRPVLINNWEATYFEFNEEKLLQIAKSAKELGIELFVLDDGWFGKRNDDNSSLGDWFEDRGKLPNGLKGLREKLHKQGLDFGLWVEPEMVSKDSDLYRKHPDWCLHIPQRGRTESRNQLVLDLSRTEICDWLIDTLSDLFGQVELSYVKWDMNRNMTEVWSKSLPAEQQGEVFHRYLLGLYRVLETLNQRFPHILFESCSGGGGRFDPGMLYYMPQTWTSDNTDAIERLKIQYGTSLVYPAITMGAHVSVVPNHQVQRHTSLLTRLQVAMGGNLGFELDLTQLDEEEKELIRQQISIYKEIRSLVQFGRFYRLSNPFENNITAWSFVSEDRKEVVFFYCRVMAEPHSNADILRLKGLTPEGRYRLLDMNPFLEALGYDSEYGGDALMYAGFRLTPFIGDFQTQLLRFSAA